MITRADACLHRRVGWPRRRRLIQLFNCPVPTRLSHDARNCLSSRAGTSFCPMATGRRRDVVDARRPTARGSGSRSTHVGGCSAGSPSTRSPLVGDAADQRDRFPTTRLSARRSCIPVSGGSEASMSGSATSRRASKAGQVQRRTQYSWSDAVRTLRRKTGGGRRRAVVTVEFDEFVDGVDRRTGNVVDDRRCRPASLLRQRTLPGRSAMLGSPARACSGPADSAQPPRCLLGQLPETSWSMVAGAPAVRPTPVRLAQGSATTGAAASAPARSLCRPWWRPAGDRGPSERRRTQRRQPSSVARGADRRIDDQHDRGSTDCIARSRSGSATACCNPWRQAPRARCRRPRATVLSNWPGRASAVAASHQESRSTDGLTATEESVHRRRFADVGPGRRYAAGTASPCGGGTGRKVRHLRIGVDDLPVGLAGPATPSPGRSRLPRASSVCRRTPIRCAAPVSVNAGKHRASVRSTCIELQCVLRPAAAATPRLRRIKVIAAVHARHRLVQVASSVPFARFLPVALQGTAPPWCRGEEDP